MASQTSCDNLSDTMLSSPGSSDGSCYEPTAKRPNTTHEQKPGLIRTRKRATGRSGENSSSSAKSPGSKSTVQAKDKEPHLLQRRNARERRRVTLVNEGFIRLRRKIPTEPRNKKLSKFKTLSSAINYIMHLQETLDEEENRQQRLQELGNLGMNIPLQHAPPHQPHEWAPYQEPPVVKPGLIRTRKRATGRSGENSSSSAKSPGSKSTVQAKDKNKKLSKFKTLSSAINYIMHLQETLDEEENRQQRLQELGNLGMNIPLQHAPPHQPHEWAPYQEPPVVCNGFEYAEQNHGGYYY